MEFTSECEADNQIPFLDVLLKRRQDGTLQRSVYHKPTSSGQYLHFESSSPIEHKRALVKTLFHRARRICTSDTIDQTEENIKKDLASNSYPAEFIAYHSRVRPKAPATYDVARKPVYITLPFKGDTINMMIRKRLNATIQRTYPAARLRLLNRSRKIGPLNTKIKKSIFAESKCIYRFECTCGCKYIGRTDRKLENRVKEHVPPWLLKNRPGKPKTAICKHLMSTHHHENVIDFCSQTFSIACRQRTFKFLKLAEACLIRRYQPDLCAQKEYVETLGLPWG